MLHHPRLNRPQISTMPRAKTEAAAYLDIYKLVNEKTRVQQELQGLDAKRDRLQARLASIEAAVLKLEQSAHRLRNAPPLPAPTSAPRRLPPSRQPDSFDTLFLDY